MREYDSNVTRIGLTNYYKLFLYVMNSLRHRMNTYYKMRHGIYDSNITRITAQNIFFNLRQTDNPNPNLKILKKIIKPGLPALVKCEQSIFIQLQYSNIYNIHTRKKNPINLHASKNLTCS